MDEACQWCARNLNTVVGKQSSKKSRRSATKLDERRFLFVGLKDIDRSGNLAKLEWETKDRIHALHELHLEPGKVDVKGRDIACRCPPCQQTLDGPCMHKEWVDAPRHISIQLKKVRVDLRFQPSPAVASDPRWTTAQEGATIRAPAS